VPELAEQPGGPQREDVVAMLATYGDRQPDQVPEAIDSLELAWLIHQIEQRYGVLDVDDDMITRMSTVTGVLDVLTDLRVGSAHD
jgi:acyl carrier protein